MLHQNQLQLTTEPIVQLQLITEVQVAVALHVLTELPHPLQGLATALQLAVVAVAVEVTEAVEAQ